MYHIWLGTFGSEKEFEKYLDQKKHLKAWAVYDHESPTGKFASHLDPIITMERKKIISSFNKQINKTKKEGISQEEIIQYYDLIKRSIEDDTKEGFRETIARNLTLGIGVHSGEYPKHLILNGEKEGWK